MFPTSAASSSRSILPRPAPRTLMKPGSSSPARTPTSTAIFWPISPVAIRRPNGARTAIALYRQHKADRIVAEVNNGGDMVEATIRMVDPNVSYNKVHASRGKVIRAEPVAALYEQGRIHHVGAFPTLEDQQCAFTTDFDRAPPIA